MEKYWYLALIAVIFVTGCSKKKERLAGSLKLEIISTEKAFEAAARDSGISRAFYLFADEDAVIRRGNDSLITGRENIRNFYEKPFYQHATVNWSPDFAAVSDDGTLGYTYGKYTWKAPGDSGKIIEYKGVFHTVWKRQSDGGWKYVWD
jgi:ketosteroid isomerase-like protein